MTTEPARCATCKWFLPQGEKMGDCHRMPPRPLNADTIFGARFPLVHECNWCGEHAEIELRSFKKLEPGDRILFDRKGRPRIVERPTEMIGENVNQWPLAAMLVL